MRSRTSAPASGKCVKVETGMVTSYPTPPVSTIAWLGCFSISMPRKSAIKLDDVHAHAARRARDRAHRRRQVEAVQVRHLDLSDLLDLLLRDLADLDLMRFGRALRQIHRALDQHRN